jgi:hypothetical protein
MSITEPDEWEHPFTPPLDVYDVELTAPIGFVRFWRYADPTAKSKDDPGNDLRPTQKRTPRYGLGWLVRMATRQID